MDVIEKARKRAGRRSALRVFLPFMLITTLLVTAGAYVGYSEETRRLFITMIGTFGLALVGALVARVVGSDSPRLVRAELLLMIREQEIIGKIYSKKLQAALARRKWYDRESSLAIYGFDQQVKQGYHHALEEFYQRSIAQIEEAIKGAPSAERICNETYHHNLERQLRELNARLEHIQYGKGIPEEVFEELAKQVLAKIKEIKAIFRAHAQFWQEKVAEAKCEESDARKASARIR